jgi:arylformamidase
MNPTALAFAALLGSTLLPVSTKAADAPANPAPFQVQILRDFAYYQGPDVDPVKHKLDLFLPKNQKDCPVVLFVHGGAWVHGDKNFLGVYSALGMCFAKHGIATVVTNYRLSPGVKHPEHIKDVARAFAWTYRNIERYGGKPDQIFVCGHSAGGHLVALLSTDESYLKAEGLSLKTIKAAVPISGVYTLPENMFASVFGKDPDERKHAFPLNHVKEGEPPFLILYADRDFPTCDQTSEEFCKALKGKQCQAETVAIKNRNHISIIANCCVDTDPACQAILKFISAQTGKPAATDPSTRR